MNFDGLNQKAGNFFKNRQALWALTRSQTKARFAGLKLGVWWVFVIPLAMAFCINAVFVLAFKVDMPHYTFFILSGLIPWFFISQSVSESTNAFSSNRHMLRQGVFPREFIPLAAVLSNFLIFLPGFFILIPFYIVIQPAVFLLLPALAFLILFMLVFTLGLGLIFAAVNTFFKDTSYFLSTGLMFWFWMTPIFYSETMLDFPYRWICLLNPVTYYVSAFRSILYEAVCPGAGEWILLFLVSLIFLGAGCAYYFKNEQEILKKT